MDQLRNGRVTAGETERESSEEFDDGAIPLAVCSFNNAYSEYQIVQIRHQMPFFVFPKIVRIYLSK